MRSLDAAQAVIDSSTPESTRHYFAYQKWRMLFNWETLLISLSADPAVMDQAVSRIRPHFDGHDLLDVADVLRQTVPAGDPLRVIMDAEMGQRP